MLVVSPIALFQKDLVSWKSWRRTVWGLFPQGLLHRERERVIKQVNKPMNIHKFIYINTYKIDIYIYTFIYTFIYIYV